MEGFKTTVFTKRIVAFNESFVPLGTNCKNGRPIAVIWHEAICGRKKEDIISSFDTFFKYFRDVPLITLWLDNCSAQNKNWCLMTYLVHIINSSESATQTIELYFFEPEHTFMSADSFHHQVELSLSRHGKVYDFSDFENAVGATCSGKTVVKSMQHEDFAVWPSCVSNYKLNKFVNRPYLNDLVYIKAERGKDTLLYRLCYDEYCPLQELDFMTKKGAEKAKSPPIFRTAPRGICSAKKQDIITKLLPLMPENRKRFWLDLPESDVPDLCVSDDIPS
uniref:Uncharacterized protein LOC114349158 n=1 Tax=Diabrotica virgifera virgifera TaxID=50390 RepID=A0A6P7HCL4_DIAVI